jgi:hypothetical protein
MKILIAIVPFIMIIAGCSGKPTDEPTNSLLIKYSEITTHVDPTKTISLQNSTITPTPLATKKQIRTAEIDLNNFEFITEGYSYIYLSPFGIYALDYSNGFIFGFISANNSLRSIILKTEDGGCHWKEVHDPIKNNGVYFVSFVNENEGWLFTANTVSTMKDIAIYHTLDSGITWMKKSTIQMKYWYGMPLRMKFFSSSYGEIDIQYYYQDYENNNISILTTIDGGVTWRETYRIPLNEEPDEILLNYSNTLEENNYTMGFDKSIWYLFEENKSYNIYKKQKESIEWIQTCYIWKKYHYTNGELTPIYE